MSTNPDTEVEVDVGATGVPAPPAPADWTTGTKQGRCSQSSPVRDGPNMLEPAGQSWCQEASPRVSYGYGETKIMSLMS